MTVTPYPDPIISDYQKAFAEAFDIPVPRITRRTAKGYIVHGLEGESRLLTQAHMKRLTNKMLRWAEDKRAGR